VHVITRTQRTIVVAVAVAAIVVAADASDGAYFSQSWGWVALAFLMPSSLLLIVDRVSAPGRLRIALASLMGAFGVWIALSTIWSISPSGSTREVERVLVYVSVALAVVLVLRRGDGAAVAGGALVGVTAITAYGLATRLFPDRFDTAEDMFNAYRLAEPLGYWNAFGLVAAMAAVLAVGAVAHARRALVAVLAGAALPVLVMALYFAFSRGSWLALFFGLAATVVLDPRRITVLWSLGVTAPISAVGVAVASRQEALTTAGATAADATREGHRLAWLLAVLVPASAGLALIAHLVARRVTVSPPLRRGVAAVLAAGAVGAFAVVVVTAGGPASALSEIRDRFEAPPGPGSSLNDRLFTFSGTGRAETIAAAWDQGSERPIVGTGAGTFEILWYERRPSTQIVRDAHSLYVETFNELGVVGLTLLVAVLLVPLVGAIRARRVRFVAPACGAYLAWIAASGLDWHWEMVGLTMTALLVGAVGLVSAERRSRGGLLYGSRIALLGVTGTLSVVAVLSLVGNQALFAGRENLARKDWAEARDDARRAQALLVWSHEPHIVLGDAAAGRGDRERALREYRDAVDTDPRNWVAWLRVAQVARGAERAAAYDRVRELNPREGDLPGE
jgi:O-antigen ligase